MLREQERSSVSACWSLLRSAGCPRSTRSITTGPGGTAGTMIRNIHATILAGVRGRLPDVGRSAAHFRQAGQAASGAVSPVASGGALRLRDDRCRSAGRRLAGSPGRLRGADTPSPEVQGCSPTVRAGRQAFWPVPGSMPGWHWCTTASFTRMLTTPSVPMRDRAGPSAPARLP